MSKPKSMLVAHDVGLVRETDKAFLVRVKVEYWVKKGGKGASGRVDIWVPRSQCRLEGESLYIPEWLVEEKERDAAVKNAWDLVGIEVEDDPDFDPYDDFGGLDDDDEEKGW